MNKPLSQDELLCQLHEEYIQQVTESGMPLWVAHMYNQGYPQPGGETAKEDKDETQHQADHDQRPEIPDLPF